MSKEKFIEAHEELMEEYLEIHPNADFTEAYEETSDQVYIRYRDNWLSHVDQIIDEYKERRKDDRPT